MKKIVYILFLMTLLSCSNKAKNENLNMGKMYFDQGTQHLMNGSYSEALKYLLQSQSYIPEDDEMLNHLGMAYFFNGDSDHAIETISKAIKVNPKNSNAKNNLATVFMNLGKRDQAKLIYNDVTKDLTFDNLHRTYYNLGLIALKENDPASALRLFNSSLLKDPSFCLSHFEIAKLIADSKKSLEHYSQAALGECLGNFEIQHEFAKALIQNKRYDEAKIRIDEMRMKFPTENLSDLEGSMKHD